jgi:COP9 signalosome complex subunit 7
MDMIHVSSNSNLEQFLLLSKNAKGAAAIELVKQATEAPGVYVFGELLDMPNIKELATGPNSKHYHLLNLFAYGTYAEYKANKAKLPALSKAQSTKLRQLTIVTLATKNKHLPYTVLLKELDVANLRELEDLIIEAIYADIVHGKLDQKHQLLEVEYVIGRDIRPENIAEITAVLQDWYNSCEAIVRNLDTQIKKTNERKENEIRTLAKIEQEVVNIKKTLKVTQHQQDNDQMIVDSQEVFASPVDKPTKKTSATKSKGPSMLRGLTGKKN